MSRINVNRIREQAKYAMKTEDRFVHPEEVLVLLDIAKAAEEAMSFPEKGSAAILAARDRAICLLKGLLKRADFYDLGHYPVPQSCLDHPNYPKG